MKAASRAQGMSSHAYLYPAPNRTVGEFWRTTNTTWGNNVFAHENWEGRNAWMYNRRPEGSIVGSGECGRLVWFSFL